LLGRYLGWVAPDFQRRVGIKAPPVPRRRPDRRLACDDPADIGLPWSALDQCIKPGSTVAMIGK
jgi:hypothetical protein